MKRLYVSLIIAAIVSCVVMFVSSDFGITWDEPMHFHNGDSYLAWVKHPVWERKDLVFAVNAHNDVHPPLRKFLAGLTHDIYTNILRVLDNTRGYRISAIPFVFFLIALLTYISIGWFGYWIGILVPLVFSCIPSVLFLSVLVTMDYAVCALWFCAIMTFVKGVRGGKWLYISAILCGLTLLTKFHGFLLFVPVLFWWFIVYRRQLKKNFFTPCILLFNYICVAFCVVFLFWPWLWTDTINKIQMFFSVQLAHGSVPVWFFNKIYDHAPWYYAPVWFLVVTPVFVLIFFFLGSILSLRSKNLLFIFILFNAFYPIVFFSLPGVYRYDGVRLFLAAYPFIALLMGMGIWRVSTCKKHPIARYMVLIGITCWWIGTLYDSVVRIHPFESSYFNEVIGGINGANSMGLEVEYWGNAYLATLPYLNNHKGTMFCVYPTTLPFYYYQAMGQIEGGVIFESQGDSCEYMVVLMRKGFFSKYSGLETIIAKHTPVYSVQLDGVDLVGIYTMK